MPVFPAVPSTMIPPGDKAPDVSDERTMERAARSLTEPPGFMNSALTRIVHPLRLLKEDSSNNGVWPIRLTKPRRAFILFFENGREFSKSREIKVEKKKNKQFFV